MHTKTEATAWLRDFMSELNTQDNRATATPYYYQLRCPCRLEGVTKDNATGSGWVGVEGDTIDDIVEYLKECMEEDTEGSFQRHLNDNLIVLEDLTADDDLGIREAAEYVGATEHYYQDSAVYRGIFFTEKAALKHFKENKHNYPKGTQTYLGHAYCNPELLQLFQSIGVLVGIPYERK